MAIAGLFGNCGSLPVRERLVVPFAVLLLVCFIGFGIDMIIHPRRHMNGYLRSGGEMLRDWNEMGVQFLGVAFSCGSGWVLYQLVRSVWTRCFV
jgi:hypothetical protein